MFLESSRQDSVHEIDWNVFVETVVGMSVLKLLLKCVCLETVVEMCALKLYKQDKNDIYAKIIKDIIINYKTKYLIDQNICPNFVYYYYSNVIMNRLLRQEHIDYDSLTIDKLKLDNYYLPPSSHRWSSSLFLSEP